MVMRSRDHGDVVGYSGEIWIDAGRSLITSIKPHTDAASGGVSVGTAIEYGWVRMENLRAWLPLHSVEELIAGNGRAGRSLITSIKLHTGAASGGIAVGTAIEYGWVRMENLRAWLPVHSVEELSSGNGRAERNEIQFSRCRAFTGRSTVRFEEAAGVSFELQFNESIDPEKVLAGQRVSAELASDIKHSGTSLFPRGSPVEVRLVRLQRRKAEVSMQFALGEIAASTGGMAHLLAIPDTTRRVTIHRQGKASNDVEIGGDIKQPGLGTIYIRGLWLQLPNGHPTAGHDGIPEAVKEERH